MSELNEVRLKIDFKSASLLDEKTNSTRDLITFLEKKIILACIQTFNEGLIERENFSQNL